MRGWQEPVYPPTPAPGAAYTRKIGGEVWERVIACNAQLTTSAAVATRTLFGLIEDGDGVNMIRFPLSAGVAASATVRSWAWHTSLFNTTNETGQAYAPLPDLLLPSGWQFSISASNIDVADQISHVQLIVQKFPTDTIRHTAGELHEMNRHLAGVVEYTRRTYERISAWLDGS